MDFRRQNIRNSESEKAAPRGFAAVVYSRTNHKYTHTSTQTHESGADTLELQAILAVLMTALAALNTVISSS